jgi:NAD(P)-dependent dehydrogenase (short-subunit alcohol dehydrogenase family)
MRFKQQVVLITGAASGIGKATAEAFAREGAKLILSDRQAEAGQNVARNLRAKGNEVSFVTTNVADPEAVAQLIQSGLADFGRIDIAINNAGIGSPMNPTHTTSLKDWDRVIAVNQSGVFYCMKHQLAAMERQGSGSIVNVSSIAGLRGLPRQLPYVASKHAVIGMTKTAALEYARFGIRINAVCPVFTRTPLVDQLFATEEGMAEKLLRSIPLRRFGEVEDVVNAISWLCDPASSFVTGLCLPLDGGQMA